MSRLPVPLIRSECIMILRAARPTRPRPAARPTRPHRPVQQPRPGRAEVTVPVTVTRAGFNFSEVQSKFYHYSEPSSLISGLRVRVDAPAGMPRHRPRRPGGACRALGRGSSALAKLFETEPRASESRSQPERASRRVTIRNLKRPGTLKSLRRISACRCH